MRVLPSRPVALVALAAAVAATSLVSVAGSPAAERELRPWDVRYETAPHGEIILIASEGTLVHQLIKRKLLETNNPADTYNFRGLQWFVDGVLQKNTDFEPDEDKYRIRLVDGRTHTLMLRLPRVDGGTPYDFSAPIRSVSSMRVTAPVQSAATAREKGVLVRVTGSRGLYRAKSTSRRIPGAGHTRINNQFTGEGTMRLTGSYLSRIQPGSTLRVEVRHVWRAITAERQTVTVRFR